MSTTRCYSTPSTFQKETFSIGHPVLWPVIVPCIHNVYPNWGVELIFDKIISGDLDQAGFILNFYENFHSKIIDATININVSDIDQVNIYGVKPMSSNIEYNPISTDRTFITLKYNSNKVIFTITFNNIEVHIGTATATLSNIIFTTNMANVIDPVQIFIQMQNNTVTKDVIEVIYEVYDEVNHQNGLGKYCGNIISVKNNNNISCTLFQIYFLEVNCAVIGDGTLYNKILCFNKQLFVDGIGFIGYILLKILLGRLLYEEFNIKWAYRVNYPKLYSDTLSSIYSNSIPTLKANSEYENLLRWN